jgi:hypothetical protein
MQKGDKFGLGSQVDVAGGLGAHMPHRPGPQGRRPVPPRHLPCHRSVRVAPEALPSVDSSRFQPMDKMELTWIHQPTVIGLGGSNRHWNRLTGQNLARASFTTTIEEQPGCYDQEAVHPRADWCPYAAAQHPWTATDLLAAYKYPLTPHYK